MVKKPRNKTAKAAPDNLCLEVPVAPTLPDLIDPLTLYSLKPITPDLTRAAKIDWLAPTWKPGDAAQARSRLQRPLATSYTTTQVAEDAKLDMAHLQSLIDKYKVDMSSHLNHLYGQFVMPQIIDPNYGLKDLPRYRPRGAEDLGCVTALLDALREEHRDGAGFSVGDVVKDWRKHYDRSLNRWIFGPHGEFTGFARVDALNEGLQRCARTARRGDVVTAKLEGFPVEVSFRVTLLLGLQDIPTYRQLRDHQPLAYYQFATYRDQAAWESMAAYDRTEL